MSGPRREQGDGGKRTRPASGREADPGPRPSRSSGPRPTASPSRPADASDAADPISIERRMRVDRDPEAPRRPMERLADLLPETVRQFGLEDQLEQARAAAAWLRIVAEHVPAAAGSCRLTGLSQGVATIEADEPIVAQEIRLRSPELLRALRNATAAPVRQVRITTRHV